MPPALLFDISPFDLNSEPVYDRVAVNKVNPQRFEMQQLDGVLWLDAEKHFILGFKEVTSKEFWVRGHVPERPLMPGVVMLEAAAQLISFYTRKALKTEGFIGLGGIDSAKFRSTVVPGSRLIMLAKAMKISARRNVFDVQGLVDGTMVFEASITGLKV